MSKLSLILILLTLTSFQGFSQDYKKVFGSQACLTEVPIGYSLMISDEEEEEETIRFLVEDDILNELTFEQQMKLEKKLSHTLSLSKNLNRRKENDKRYNDKFSYLAKETITSLIKNIKNTTTINIKRNISIQPVGVHNFMNVVSRDPRSYQDLSNDILKDLNDPDILKANKGVCGLSFVIRFCDSK